MFAKFGYTYGTDLNDDLTGTAGVDEINGLAGNDSIYGGAGNDTLDGGTGNDNIFGEDGDDILIGGEGNDYLIGGNGADTYIFNPGFGNDAIDNSDDNASASEPDIIQFGEGILASKTTLGRQGYDLIITVSYDPDEEGYTRPNDSIRIYSYFDQQGTSSATVNSIVFADGTTWDYEYVRDHWNSIPGANGGVTLEGNNEDNTINGTSYNDILIGNGGNDTINAGNGNDRLLGGTGNDTLNGGSGDDTYLWNWGDGMDTISDTGNHDKISFGDGITYSDLKFRQEGGNLRITVKNNENQGMLINGFFSSLDYKIEDLYFQDGSIVHLSEIPLTLHQLNTDETINLTGNGDTVYANGGNDTINGGQGNDFIYGGSGNDTVNAGHGNDIVTGGTGNDYLDGSWGSDTYIYNRGDGLDTISDSDGQNILKFGADISFDDLTFRNDNGSLRILINGNENQGIICKNFFTNDSYKINRIVFNDGTMYPVSATGLTLVQKESSETVTDTVYNDTIYGNNGDDTITCGDGNDVIYGGSGHDAINAGNGEDTIIGGKGDDALNGNAGADTYIYNVGDGLDTIWASNVDTLVFGEGISQNDLTFRQEGNNLRILINGSETDGIIDVNYYQGDGNKFKEIHFADGSVLDLRDIGFTMNQNNGSETVEGTSHADIINGNGGNDTIEARGGNDIVNGGLGDDIIRGHDGNDIITGGKGNDALDGGSGDDAYIYNLGDGYDTIYDASGVDTIKFGVGISFDDLTFHAEGNHLVINVGNNSDQGIFIYHMLNDQSYNIERLEFADGTIKNLSQMGFTFNQNETSEEINGTVYDDIINANGGNDTISAGNGNDILNGGSGNDTINANNGDDILIGGTGRDTLNGGSGDDSYIYNIGDGADHISDSSGYDNITFGEGISFEDLSFRMSGNDLKIIINNDETQYINISQYFYDNERKIEELNFSDGSQYYLNDIDFNITQTDIGETITTGDWDDTVIAGAGNDTIDTGEGYDTIDAGDGNDTINAGNGNDSLTGGRGNDILNGGNGNDTYYYNLGDGQDTINETGGVDKIVFGTGITREDLSFRQEGNNLIIKVKGDENQQITINNHFKYEGKNIEEFHFADGTVYNTQLEGFTLQLTDNAETITSSPNADTIYAAGGDDIIDSDNGNDFIDGGLGNDTITAGHGDDILIGSKGNDTLNGGSGHDTYKYNFGDGADVINETDGNDTLAFGSGISAADITYRQTGKDLILIIQNDESQQIKIVNFFNSDNYKVENFTFADGTTIQANEIGFTIKGEDYAETINGTSFADIINGNDGNDTIDAGAGNNIVNGGNGNDTITTGVGDDIISGGKDNDILNGGSGSDTYKYNLGDGYDEITDAAGVSDRISFGSGISYNDLTFRAEGSHLRIIVKGDETQGILIKEALNNSSYAIDYLDFADGSSVPFSSTGLTFAQKEITETINATNFDDIVNAEAGNDTINAKDGNDILNGGAGNDTVEGGEGNDIITGGKGRDILNGGSGDDTYIYNRGDGFDEITENGGNDKIVFGEGIAKTDLIFIQDGNNLKIQLNGNSEESITVKNHFNENNNYKIERLEFADGTSIDLGSEELQLIHQTDLSETLSGNEYNNTLYGFGGNDTLNAGTGDDILDGGIGNDTLNGDLGNDKLTGGKGDDTLNGGAGDDIYYYNLGDGVDTINEAAGTDKIIFGEGIASSDIKYRSVNEDLYLTIKGDATQSIRLVNFFNASTNYRLEALQFADGTIINISTTGLTYQQQDVSETVNCLSWNDVINAGGGNDTINANGGDDIIYAEDGNDIVNAGEGNDTLVGGKGNDTLNGGVGSDIYHYNLGDGFDTIYDEGGTDRIVFGEGIAFSDLSFRNEGNNLRVFVKGNEQQGFCINDFFNGNNYKIERLQFADGSSKSLRNLGLTFNQSNDSETITGTNYNDVIYANGGDDIINASGGSDTIYAGNGNDIVNAGAGNDNMHGGLGDDALNGGDGNDTYYYNLGDGLDTITETSGTDKIIFGEGISSSDLVYTRDGNNLHINIKGDYSQGLVIKDYFYSLNNKIENLQFADNSIINLSTQGIVLTQSDLSDTITTVSDNDDVVYGNGGADTISTSSGNDILVGGKGQDTLDGGAGNDTYCFNIGDGYDTITDSSGTDKIVFGEGIASSSLVYNRHGNDLTIVVNDLDSIKVKNFFTSDSIESLEFFDGSSLSLNPETISISPLEDEDIVFTGTSASETITGGVGDDTLDGNGGNDTIYGGQGNDYININNATNTVHGGTGNDYINGSSGNDTYHYNRGDGFDTIVEYNGSNDKIIFGEGITRENLSFYADRNSLRILIDNDENQGILILNHFETDAKHMEYIEFADGTTIDLSQGIPFAQTNGNDILNGANDDDHYNSGSGNDYLKGYAGNDILSGDAGNDNLYGDDGDDILTGGTGNDYLEGGRGTDTYIYNLGDGFDVINNYDYYNSGNDKIQFGQGISLSDLTFKVDGSSLRININGDEKQGLLLQRHQEGGDYRMGKLEFADGSVFDLNTNGFTYHQTDQKDNLSGTGYDDIIYLNAGNDTAHGNNGNDTIYGGTGLDNLYGDGGNDILVGGTGDDYLEGGREEDTYIYNLGDGFDTINNYDYYNSGKDKILFGEGISLSDLTFSSDNKDLLIYINNDKSQGMRILRHFEGGDYRLGKIQFADGSILDFETTGVTLTQGDDNNVITTLNQNDTVLAGGGNDSISTNYGDDIINAGAGNDNVDAGYGNDDITGGKGNDILNGDNGADTYRYNLGDGFDIIYDYDSNSNNIDKIVFGEGITLADLTFRNENNNLRIIVKGDEGQGMLINQFFNENYPSYYQIEQFEFADGTIIDNKSNGFVFNQLSADETIRATEYNDIIKANSGNDTIDSFNGNDIIDAGSGDDYVEAGYGNDDITGGKGNDILNGSYGADTYRYNLGDGFDIIYDYDSNSNNIDKIVFGEGISQDNLTFRLEGTSLRIIINNDETQGMLLDRFLDRNYESYYKIEQFVFADGSIMDNKAIGYKLEQLDFSEDVRTTEFADTVNANGGNDTVVTLGGNDIINGGAGNDYIDAGYGDDHIIGGTGNDKLIGYRGSDTYYYNIGDGFDTIEDYNDTRDNSVDKIVFGEGISKEDLTFSYEGGNLKIIIGEDTAQGIMINGFFSENYSSYYRIEKLEFADGSVIDFTTTGVNLIQSNGSKGIRGTEFADTIIADDTNHTIITLGGNDTIVSGSGHDRIEAGYGDDDITGGKGDDLLIGSYGSDTYRYNLGDGFDIIDDYDSSNTGAIDKIVFGEGITKDDLKFACRQDHLFITIKDDPTQGIRINFYFNDSSASYYKIEKLVFADGSEIDMNTTNLVLTQTDTAETVKATEFDDTIYAKGGNDTIYAKGGNDTIYGGDGNDRIEAGSGNDILVGGKGDDTLIGSTGSDTYLWNLGDGFDTIDDYEDPSVGNVDKIVFGEGITFNDLTFRNKNGGLDIYVNGDETQGVHINFVFNGSNESYYQIEQLQFADGSTVELSQIGLTFDQTNGDEVIKTTAYDDVINAGAGNDNITALAGNDIIFGEDGNDTINAGSGNDNISGGKGNDTLMGGTGNDTYYYNLGDGWDTIEDNDGTEGNNDTISFGAGIAFADLTFTQRDTNLEIVIKGDSSQGIVINRFFDPSYRKNFCIEKLAFADGTIIDVSSLGLVLNQTNGSETIYGSDNNDTINANGGNDTVYGYAGNDIINGGSGRDTIDAGAGNDNITGSKGDDIINGGTGNDTYYYNLGDGLDTITDNDSTAGNLDKIVFGAGIVKTDLSLSQRDNDLLITVNGDASQGILISRFFDPSYRANFCVEKLEFADGSSVDFRNTGITFNQTDSADTVSGTAFNDTVYAGGGNDTINTGSGNDIIRGGTGNDTINAGDGNDTITGGTGNDIIDGGLGNDTYVYKLGDGFDHINDAGGVDSIHFGEGITRSDLTLFDDNGSLRVTIKGDSEQGMLINKHFSDTNYKIESFQFADGSSINIGSADQLIQAMNSFSASNSASTDALSNPTEDVSDMYSLAANSDLTRKAI